MTYQLPDVVDRADTVGVAGGVVTVVVGRFSSITQITPWM